MVSSRSPTPHLPLPLPLPPQEHFNYYSLDTALGHLVFSLKYDVIGDQEHLRLLLRYGQERGEPKTVGSPRSRVPVLSSLHLPS